MHVACKIATNTKAAMQAKIAYNRTSEVLKNSAILFAVDCSVDTKNKENKTN